MNEEEMKACEGFRTSDCCGHEIIHGDLCLSCKDHCDNQCSICEHIIECPNYQFINP